jgi:protein-arginine kinase
LKTRDNQLPDIVIFPEYLFLPFLFLCSCCLHLAKVVSDVGKVFVALDDRDQVILQSICVDKNPQEALRFVLKNIAPKLHKQVPCIAREMMRSERM